MNKEIIKSCSNCNWTNISLLNLGNFGKSKMVCHGCAKRAIVVVETMKRVLHE